MAASNTDKFKKVARKWTGTIGSGGVPDGTTDTIPLASATNLPTDTAVVATIDRVDANGNLTPAKEEMVIGVVSGSDLVDSIRGVEGTAQAHSVGAVVEILITAKGWNDLIDGILEEHNQDGTHDNTKVAMLATNQTFTGTKTFSSGLLIATKPKIITSIDDVNSNEAIKISATSSAVNEITVSNAATGNAPIISATGDDTNIDLKLKGKGNGKVRAPVECVFQVVNGSSDVSTGDGKYYLTIPQVLNGMNLVSCHARVVTAGTTGTTDIQIANVTDEVDMLSTKLTIDSGETGSDTAATPYVIDTSHDDVATNDLIRIDIDAVSSTPPKGLIIRLGFDFAS